MQNCRHSCVTSFRAKSTLTVLVQHTYAHFKMCIELYRALRRCLFVNELTFLLGAVYIPISFFIILHFFAIETIENFANPSSNVFVKFYQHYYAKGSSCTCVYSHVFAYIMYFLSTWRKSVSIVLRKFHPSKTR